VDARGTGGDVWSEPIAIVPRRTSQRPSIVAVALLIGLALAVAKPWAGSDQGGPGSSSSSSGANGIGRASSPKPAPTPSPDVDLERVAAFCLEPAGWRLFATEEFGRQRVRSWKTMEPAVAAVGPGDPAIPFIPEASQAVLTLGYCAPVEGPERPPGATVTTIYQRAETDAGEDVWVEIEPQPVQSAGAGSRLGGAWRAPGQARPSLGEGAEQGWASDAYVFRIATIGAEDEVPFVRWFGVVVEVVPAHR
jgi:hypothetical protein